MAGNNNSRTMRINLKVWRQKNQNVEGQLVDYALDNVSPDMSFLEMFDVLNEQLVKKGEEPIAFAHDCREGICGSCAMVIDGERVWHGAEAIHWLCARMTPSAALLQVLAPLLADGNRARGVYPLLLLARRLALGCRGLPADPDARA